MSMRNDRPSTRRWARVAVFGGGALVLLLVGYVIGATLFPVSEPPSTVAQVTPPGDGALMPTFTPSPEPPTETATALPTDTLLATPTHTTAPQTGASSDLA